MVSLKVLFVFGTRPEAIKLCPVVRALKARPEDFDVRVCVTAQHREMLDQVLAIFGVEPDHDLNVMRDSQSLTESASRILERLEPLLKQDRPGMLLGHVEAGLRTGDVRQPFPEEMNRVLVSRLAALHFAATSGAAQNLRSEGVPGSAITVTGNSGIDAVLYVRDRLVEGTLGGGNWDYLDASRKLILVTAHRRESFGAGFERICAALRHIADMEGVSVVYPVHPNPNVSSVVLERLKGHPHIHLLDPLDYVSFVDLMRRAYLLLTDSGGIQEEAPSLGKPVLVLREKTERPEAVNAGTATLVGTDVEAIVSTARRLIQDEKEYDRRRRIHNPYGDGHASERIAEAILASSPR